jgi:hypothetical protein
MSEKTYYITKYALTKGILAAPADICRHSEAFPGYLRVENYFTSFRPSDWYASLAQAEGRVLEMRNAEVKKLTTRLKKLKTLAPFIKVTGVGK